MFTATTLKMAWLSQGKGGIFKPRTYGEKPCVSHPLKNPDFGWGQLFCWVVGGWQACPHARSTSCVIHSRGQGRQQGMFFHSPILCIIFGSPPHAQASTSFGDPGSELRNGFFPLSTTISCTEPFTPGRRWVCVFFPYRFEVGIFSLWICSLLTCFSLSHTDCRSIVLFFLPFTQRIDFPLVWSDCVLPRPSFGDRGCVFFIDPWL